MALVPRTYEIYSNSTCEPASETFFSSSSGSHSKMRRSSIAALSRPRAVVIVVETILKRKRIVSGKIAVLLLLNMNEMNAFHSNFIISNVEEK